MHKIAYYAAIGTVHPEGGKDESSQSRTSASPCIQFHRTRGLSPDRGERRAKVGPPVLRYDARGRKDGRSWFDSGMRPPSFSSTRKERHETSTSNQETQIETPAHVCVLCAEPAIRVQRIEGTQDPDGETLPGRVDAGASGAWRRMLHFPVRRAEAPMSV